MVTRAQLVAVMPLCGPHVDKYVDPLTAAMQEFGIATPPRVRMFLPQIAVESAQLSAVYENLNYSAEGLANTWPARYARKDASGYYVMTNGRKTPNDLALRLQRHPEAIANNLYADRMGNGPESSGDGWLHRGAGLIQLTGKAMQLAAAKELKAPAGVPVTEWLGGPVGACRSAAWYFASHGCNLRADMDDFDGVCDLVNIGRKTKAEGDSIGYVKRKQFFDVCKRVFN